MEFIAGLFCGAFAAIFMTGVRKGSMAEENIYMLDLISRMHHAHMNNGKNYPVEEIKDILEQPR